MASRVLIVEDSPTQAARLKHVLTTAGFEVAVASRGQDAIGMAKANPPDLLVSDVNMPGMDGYELCRVVRADKDISDLAILLLTGMSDPEDIILGLDAGADSYLTKPYEESELADRINFVLSNKVEERLAESPLEVNFLGKKHSISASRAQMLGLLLSTYESAAQQNRRLNREQLNFKMVQREQGRRLRKLEQSSESIHSSLETLVESNVDPILVVEPGGKLLGMNTSAKDVFGSGETFLDKRVGDSPTAWNGQEVRWKDGAGAKVSGEILVIPSVWSGQEALLLQVRIKEK